MVSYFDAGLAPSTARTYRAGIKKYLSFCEQLHVSPTPSTEQLLCRFITSLAKSNITHNTIKVYLAAVRQLHIQRDYKMPAIVDMPRLQQVLRGIKITQAAASEGAAHNQSRLPITPEELLRIKTAWEHEGIDFDKTMLWAAFTLCFFCFMRSGEICVMNSESFDATKDLTPEDIAIDNIANPKVLRVHLRHSKTDPFREGAELFVARTNNELCPVAAMLSWLVRRGNSSGPLFLFQSGKPLTRSSFVSCLKQALAAAGFDSTRFSGHSFRIGAATTAAKCGLSDSTIKQLGRWRSVAYQRYIRPTASTPAALASSISSSHGR